MLHAEVYKLRRLQLRKPVPRNNDLPCGGLVKSSDKVKQGSLSGTGRANDYGKITLCETECDAVNRSYFNLRIMVGFVYIIDLDYVHCYDY